jgi:hypothetical protein
MIFDRTKRHHVAGLFTVRDRVRFKSTPSVPQPANPQAVSTAQTGSNVNTAVANATLGNVNTYSPFGSTTYNQTGTTDVNGNAVPSFSQTTSLNPTLQGVLTGTENTAASLVPTGQKLAGEAATSTTTPLNFSGANNDIIQGGPQAIYQPATVSSYNTAKSFLDPQWNTQGQQLQDQLSRQGIPVGSDAYNQAMTNFNSSKTQAYGDASNTAIGQGINAGSNMFNLALLGQQQNIAQQQTAQQNPLNLLKSLYSTGVA